MTQNLYNNFITTMQEKNRECLIFDGQVYSNKDFLSYTYQIQNLFALQKNQVVATICNNTPSAIASFLAVAREGICIPINPQYKAEEIRFIFQDLNVTAALVDEGIVTPAFDVAKELRVNYVSVPTITKCSNLEVTPKLSTRNNEDYVFALYTSGTTAKPKLVYLKHKNFFVSLTSATKAFQLTSDDVYINIMPLYHIHGFFLSLASIILGMKMIFVSNFEAKSFCRLLQDYSPSFYSSSPSFHKAILEEVKNTPIKHSLRFIRSSSFSLKNNLKSEMETIFGVPIVEGYGMTETTVFVTNNIIGTQKNNSVGKSIGPEIAIVDNDKNFLLPHQEGEIIFRGDHIITKYGNSHEDSFWNGWLLSGDLGYLDDEGYLFITGRKKEMVNRGGQKISPYKVESTILLHENVKEVAVFPVNHDSLGETVAAAVVLHQEVANIEQQLKSFLQSLMASYKIPEKIIAVESIPKTSTGKIQRYVLKNTFKDLLTKDFSSAATNYEQIIVTICQKILEKSDINTNESFFNLGGDSLSAMRLISHLQQQGIEITLQDIFEQASLKDLANYIEKGDQKEKKKVLPRITKVRNVVSQPVENSSASLSQKQTKQGNEKDLNLSIYFFSANGSQNNDNKYHFFLETTKFADQNGFHSVWMPERHFSNFGGLYPNPSILGAALAVTTKNLYIRAGSVVIPLQNPLRVVEEWSIIDNLSGGRIGIACASGWHTNDFVLAPENYEMRKQVMLERIQIIQKLWHGEKILLENGSGNEVETGVFPRPMQKNLPIWMASHADSTFLYAAENGFNILMTHWDKKPEEIGRQIKLYKENFQTKDGKNKPYVTLMMHTFVGSTQEKVIETATNAYESYLHNNIELLTKQIQGIDSLIELSTKDKAFLIENATPRMMDIRGLIGTPEICLQKMQYLQEIGVDEVACLIDFGISLPDALRSLELLKKVHTQL